MYSYLNECMLENSNDYFDEINLFIILDILTLFNIYMISKQFKSKKFKYFFFPKKNI